ncbi:restriction endonuclease subunit S [Chryseobacterium sp. HMWF035]|uniref:restriction endonuclease subunit S n=1 Tax=Chryseobacterium sp. HMWF035 TaxID=2056868 RepID=UPI000D5631DC|nr:restriction endonuclease subunit S [Chryseobacterium sp. HMWF035]PVV55388.1 restriction endonuclease subunit S [Chryseobacterium sp. HMWF035]
MTEENKSIGKFPNLRFPGFEGEWEETTLGNLGSIITGSTPPTNEASFYNGNRLFISPVDIQTSRYIFKTKTTLTEKGFNKGRIIRKGSTYFVCIGSTIGKVGQATEESITNQQINSIIPFNNDDDFVFSLLEYSSARIKSLSAEQAVPIINKTTFSNVQVIIPSIKEQKKISLFFKLLDIKIQTQRKIIEDLRLLKKNITKKIFNQQIKFKNTNQEEFSNWELTSLENILIKYEEKSTYSNQYPILTSARTGIYFQKDYFDDNEVASKDNTGYNVVPKGYFTYRHMSDDTIFKFNINDICDKGIVSTLYPVFTTTGVNNYFLKEYLNEGQEFKNYALLQKQGGSRTYMYFNKLSRLMLYFPPIDEQNKIAEFLKILDDKINLENELLTQYENQKKYLLQNLFV